MRSIIKVSSKELLVFFVLMLVFVPLAQVNYLFFHLTIEFLAIFVSLGIFVFYYNTRHYDIDGMYQVLGVSYLFVGVTDYLHTVAYKGMDVIPYSGGNEAIGLWLFARAIEVSALVAAPFFYKRSLSFKKLLAVAVVIFLLLSTFYYKLHTFFPVFFIENIGLSPAKNNLEYLFCLLLIIPLGLIYRLENKIDDLSRRYLLMAIIFTILSELSFTLYVDLYGVMNVVGHMLKIVSFYYIYKAMIDVTIQEPLSTLFGRINDEKKISALELERTKTFAKRNLKELVDYKKTLDQGFVVFMINAQGLFVQVNDNLCKILEIEREQLLGHPLKKIFAKFNLNDLSTSQSQLYIFEEQLRHGKKLWLSGVMTPFYDEQRKVESFLYVGHDITRHKEQEELLIKNQKMTAIGEAASQILHDMMNPLMIIHYANESIKGISKSFEGHQDQKELLKKIEMIEESYVRMTSFLKNFRTQMQADISNDSEFIIKTIPLNSVVKRAQKFCEHLFISHNIDVQIKVDPNIVIDCYEHQLAQVFVNLFSNSVDAIKNSHERWIKITHEYREREHLIWVTDSGPGIAQALHPEIFKNFFTTKKETGGTGLGMGICRSILEAHKGELQYNPDSKNTEFWVILPQR